MDSPTSYNHLHQPTFPISTPSSLSNPSLMNHTPPPSPPPTPQAPPPSPSIPTLKSPQSAPWYTNPTPLKATSNPHLQNSSTIADLSASSIGLLCLGSIHHRRSTTSLGLGSMNTLTLCNHNHNIYLNSHHHFLASAKPNWPKLFSNPPRREEERGEKKKRRREGEKEGGGGKASVEEEKEEKKSEL